MEVGSQWHAAKSYDHRTQGEMSRALRKRIAGEENGFTPPEMIVTTIHDDSHALYCIFDMGLRTFAYGNDKVEASENARLRLKKMTEISGPTPYDNTREHHTAPIRTSSMPARGLTPNDQFGNDLDGNRKVES